MAYHRYHGMDTRIVRIFNTYGPRMRPRDGRVVSNFIVQALCGEPLTIYGDGSQTRSFCYVDDEVEGIYRLFERGDSQPVNIGNPDEYTVRQLAEIVIEVTGTKSVDRVPAPAGGRSQGSPTGHLARSHAARMGAARSQCAKAWRGRSSISARSWHRSACRGGWGGSGGTGMTAAPQRTPTRPDGSGARHRGPGPRAVRRARLSWGRPPAGGGGRGGMRLRRRVQPAWACRWRW